MIGQRPQIDVATRANSACRENVRLITAFFLAGFVILFAAGVAGISIHLLYPPPDMAALRTIFLPHYWSDICPEPVERAAWLAGVVTTFPAALLVLTVMRNTDAGATRSCAPVLGLAAALFFAPFIGSDLVGDLLHGDPANPSSHGAHPFLWLMGAAAIIAAAFLVRRLLKDPARATVRRWRISASRLSLLLGAAVILSGVALRIRTAILIGGDPHFEPVLYSMSQVAAGKTLLADLPAQYGLYAEMLRPVFALTGLSVLKFTLLLTVLQTGAALALAQAAAAHVRSGLFKVLLVLSLCWIVGTTWSSVYALPFGYEYFQVWPIRFLFPAISTWIYLRAEHIELRHVVLLAILAGFALIWNLDSGVPTAGALVGCMLIRTIFARPRQGNLKLLAIALGLPVLIADLFLGYLDLKAGGGFQLQEWTKYQRIFYQSGFGMLPLPRYPHPWMAIAGLYLFAIVGGIFAHQRGKPGAAWDSLLYLAILGIGLLTYYQGRSHVVVLTLAMWPSIPIAFILAERSLRAARARLLPPLVGWTAAPVIAFGLMMSVLWISSAPKLVFMTAKEAAWATFHYNQNRNLVNIPFVKSRTADGAPTAIIDEAQAVYFAEAGLASATPGPGIGEMVLAADQRRMIAAVAARRPAHLFLGLGKDGAVPIPYRPLLVLYRPIATSTGELQYLEPRSIPSDQAPR